MKTVQYFRATRKSNRFNQGQKVWIRLRFGNHFWVWYKFRGKGRKVSGMIDADNSAIGPIKTIEVSDKFAERIEGMYR